MRLSSIITSIALVGALTLVSACVAEVPPVVIETPSPTPTVSVDPSPSASPSPSPTREGLSTEELLEILPEDADIPDIRGAMIVARYFLELRQELYAGDQEARALWESLSTDNCLFCVDVADSSAEFIESEKRRVGGEISFRERPGYASLSSTERDVALIRETFETAPWEDLDGDSKVVGSGPSSTVTISIRLVLSDGLWMVDGATVESQE